MVDQQKNTCARGLADPPKKSVLSYRSAKKFTKISANNGSQTRVVTNCQSSFTNLPYFLAQFLTMAGTRSPKTKVDKTKKRKRDTNEADGQAKRVRPQEANGDLVANEKELAEAAGQNLVAKMDSADAGWRISKPMGGRMLDIDPILSADEQYVLLADC